MDADSKIKVLIVDDHLIVRRGLIILFENFDEFEVVGETSNGQMALTLCEHQQPDVVLMDLMMPIMSGVETIQMLVSLYPQIKIVVLSSEISNELLQEALQAGAIGYLLKNGSVDDVAEAIRRAYRGQSTLAPQAVEQLILLQQTSPRTEYNLSERELQVLALMRDGLNNRVIADHLFISASTVKNHISNILSKLGVENRVSAVALALRNNLLPAT